MSGDARADWFDLIVHSQTARPIRRLRRARERSRHRGHGITERGGANTNGMDSMMAYDSPYETMGSDGVEQGDSTMGAYAQDRHQIPAVLAQYRRGFPLWPSRGSPPSWTRTMTLSSLFPKTRPSPCGAGKG